MRCGKCKQQPSTIEHVRTCYGLQTCRQNPDNPAPVVSSPQEKGRPTTAVVGEPYSTTTGDDITERQAAYIVALLEQKQVTEDEVTEHFGFTILDCFKDEASEVIQYLKGLPSKQQQQQTTNVEPDVPAGRYGLLQVDTWRFYQVDKPKEGKWAGRTFLSVLASDEKHPVRIALRRAAILNRIAENPAKAARDYGQQTGRCGVCNRLLTDPESIQAGIGPVCAARY